MFSGLYGDLPKTKQDKDGASKAIKGTSDELDNAIEGHGNKKDVWTADATQKGTIAMAPPVLKRGPVRSKAVSYQSKAKSNSVAVARKSDTNGAKVGAGPSGITDKSTATDYSEEGVVDPYDPAKPNDYIEIRQQRENARRAAEEEAEKMERMKELEALEKLEAQQQGIDAASSKRRMELSVDGEQAYKRRAGIPLERTDGVESSKPLESVKGMTLAQKMMEKMGWKAGEGLGKNKQGISSALTVEKTDVRSGRVVQSSNPYSAISKLDNQEPAGPLPARATPVPPRNPISSVIILKNIVGPGEVDESLDEEIGTECSKFGEVLSVLIFEVTDKSFPPEAAVRVFVQFDSQRASERALTELNGRYFGGRAIRVDYFDEARFEASDLAPEPDEDKNE